MQMTHESARLAVWSRCATLPVYPALSGRTSATSQTVVLRLLGTFVPRDLLGIRTGTRVPSFRVITLQHTLPQPPKLNLEPHHPTLDQMEVPVFKMSLLMAQVGRLGPKVGSHLALLCIHRVNRVTSRND